MVQKNTLFSPTFLSFFSFLLLLNFSTHHAKAASGFLQSALEIREQELSSTDVTSFLKNPWSLQNSPVPISPNWESIYPWKRGITTTIFWIGEKSTCQNPTPNDKSSWDSTWQRNYGGYDCPDPKGRIGFRPAGFVPRQNPFYVALPYNDIDSHGTKPEAPHIIPWFRSTFEHSGKSVVKGRWIAILHDGKVCFAQWEDSGPFRSDHWQYVFGNSRPMPNKNGNAGLDVSPAVRDYLGLGKKDITDWKFVECGEVPAGPWSKYGKNNPFSPYFKQQGATVNNLAASNNQ